MPSLALHDKGIEITRSLCWAGGRCTVPSSTFGAHVGVVVGAITWRGPSVRFVIPTFVDQPPSDAFSSVTSVSSIVARAGAPAARGGAAATRRAIVKAKAAGR